MKRISKKRQLEYLLQTIESCQITPGRAEFKKVYDVLLNKFDDDTAAAIINLGIKKRKVHHALDNTLAVVVSL